MMDRPMITVTEAKIIEEGIKQDYIKKGYDNGWASYLAHADMEAKYSFKID